MQVLTGAGVECKDRASLPDGAVVTVLADPPRPDDASPPHLQAELEAAIDEADREEGICAEELFEQIERYR